MKINGAPILIQSVVFIHVCMSMTGCGGAAPATKAGVNKQGPSSGASASLWFDKSVQQKMKENPEQAFLWGRWTTEAKASDSIDSLDFGSDATAMAHFSDARNPTRMAYRLSPQKDSISGSSYTLRLFKTGNPPESGMLFHLEKQENGEIHLAQVKEFDENGFEGSDTGHPLPAGAIQPSDWVHLAGPASPEEIQLVAQLDKIKRDIPQLQQTRVKIIAEQRSIAKKRISRHNDGRQQDRLDEIHASAMSENEIKIQKIDDRIQLMAEARETIEIELKKRSLNKDVASLGSDEYERLRGIMIGLEHRQKLDVLESIEDRELLNKYAR